MVKRNLKIFIAILIVFIVSGFIVYIKIHPPLSGGGITWNQYDDTTRVLEIINEGSANIELKSVLVNNTETPEKVELGVSRSMHIVLGGGLDEDPDITFHDISEYKIIPRARYSSEEMDKLVEAHDRTVIKSYGIRIDHNKPLENVIIKYRYYWIPFTYEIDVKID